MGTPDNPGGCQLQVFNTSNSITLEGLTSAENAKVFDAAYNVVWSCDPWNGNPCQNSASINNLQSGATYFVSVQSNLCDEFIAVTLSGPSNNLPDLTTSNLSIANVVSNGVVTFFTFDLNNFGNITASNNYSINAYLSTNQTVDAGDFLVGDIVTGNTGVGTQANVQGAILVSTQTPPGSYYFILAIDDFDAIPESNENNNLTITSIQLQNAVPLVDAQLRNSLDNQKEQVETPLEITNLFPNPTKGQLTIELNSNRVQEGSLQVFDINGRVVMEKSISLDKTLSTYNIDVKELKSGIYHLSILTDDKSVQRRFIRQ